MTGYLALRLLRAVLTIAGITTVSFFLLRIHGNPAALMLPETASAEEIEALDRAFGFDRPWAVQYLDFMGSALRGDLGPSLRQNVPALGLVLQRMPATIELALACFFTALSVAFALAMAVQITGSQRLRAGLLWFGIVRQAVPTFVLAVFLVLIFSVHLGWFPTIGRGTWRHLALPVAAVATFEIALYVRLIDQAFGEQSGQDYVRTAYSKGATSRRVILRHMLPNALLPVLTIAGINLGSLLGGLVIIETLFNWPGIGQLVIEAVNARDFPIVQAALLVVSTIFVAVNLGVDLLYAAIDPRVRLR